MIRTSRSRRLGAGAHGSSRHQPGHVAGPVDYITLHVPLMDQTKGMLNRDKFALMKKGVRIVNLARGGLVKNADLLEALKAGTVGCYVTDFPDDDLLDVPNVIPIPTWGVHARGRDNCHHGGGASARLSRERHVKTRSTSRPARCRSWPQSHRRRQRQRAQHGGQITTVLAADKITSSHDDKSAGELAYNIIDIDGDVAEAQVEKLRKIEGVNHGAADSQGLITCRAGAGRMPMS